MAISSWIYIYTIASRKICWFQKEYEEYNNQAVQYNVILKWLKQVYFPPWVQWWTG